MNRGSSQTDVCCRERRSPDARADGLRVYDKRSETCRREEAEEGEEGRREGRGKKRRRARLGQLRLAGRRFPTHTLDLGFGDATTHALCIQWSGSSSTTSKNCSKKSIS